MLHVQTIPDVSGSLVFPPFVLPQLAPRTRVAASDTDSQSPIFWERFRRLFASNDDARASDVPRRGFVITVCVMIAFVLWLVLTVQERKTVTLDVPTRVTNVPDNEALSTLPPDQVQVEINAEAWRLLRLYFNPPRIAIDATSREVDIEDVLDLPSGETVNIESVTPRRIDVAKEPKVQRRVPIRSRVDIRLPAAHELLRSPRLDPDSVTITGARSIVDGVDAWPTETRTLDNLRDSVRTSVQLSDSLRQLITLSQQTVTLQAEAGRFADAQREIEVEVTGIPANQNLVALDPSTIRVRYRILFEELFQSQRVGDFFATVSYSQIRSDTTGYVEPRIHVPPDLHIRDPEPDPRRLRYYTFVSGD